MESNSFGSEMPLGAYCKAPFTLCSSLPLNTSISLDRIWVCSCKQTTVFRAKKSTCTVKDWSSQSKQ